VAVGPVGEVVGEDWLNTPRVRLLLKVGLNCNRGGCCNEGTAGEDADQPEQLIAKAVLKAVPSAGETEHIPPVGGPSTVALMLATAHRPC
jgi:hypothetical protein